MKMNKRIKEKRAHTSSVVPVVSVVFPSKKVSRLEGGAVAKPLRSQWCLHSLVLHTAPGSST